jgi:hypothetical protein
MLIRPSFSRRMLALARVIPASPNPGSHDRRVQIAQI